LEASQIWFSQLSEAKASYLSSISNMLDNAPVVETCWYTVNGFLTMPFL